MEVFEFGGNMEIEMKTEHAIAKKIPVSAPGMAMAMAGSDSCFLQGVYSAPRCILEVF
jgi:hypothetical protein